MLDKLRRRPTALRRIDGERLKTPARHVGLRMTDKKTFVPERRKRFGKARGWLQVALQRRAKKSDAQLPSRPWLIGRCPIARLTVSGQMLWEAIAYRHNFS